MLIDQPWGVSAFGQGTAKVEPDHAVVRFAINRVAKDPSKALAGARAAASDVRSSLRSSGVLDEDVNSSRTKVNTAWDGYGASRKLVGHQCRIEFAARISSLDAVEVCLVDLVGAGADEILSVVYDSSRRAELRAAARRDAVELARAKATLYAEAAGVALGSVVHIEDVNPQRLNSEMGHRAAGDAGGSDGDALVPGSVEINAAVILGFSIA